MEIPRFVLGAIIIGFVFITAVAIYLFNTYVTLTQ